MSPSDDTSPITIHFHRRKTDGGADGAPTAGTAQDARTTDHSGSEKRSTPNQRDKPDNEKSSTSKEDDKGQGQGDEQAQPMDPAKKKRLIVVGVVVGILVILGAIWYWLYSRQFETTDDAFIDGHISQVAPQASGRIASLLIRDNEHVEAGQLLAEIDPRDYQVRLDQANAQYSQSVAQLGLQRASLGQAQANVAVSEADVFQADQDLKRFEAVDPKAVTRQQFDNAVASSRSAHAKLDANEQAVEAAKAQVQAAAANVDQASVQIDNAKLQLSYTKITAPVAGRVTRRTVEVGNVVSVGAPLLAVVSNDLWVTANYKESQLDHMQIGQHVQIDVDAFPGKHFSAHIDSFQKGSGSVFSTLPAENATGNYVKVVQRVPVKIVFDDANERDKYPMVPGLSVAPRVTVR